MKQFLAVILVSAFCTFSNNSQASNLLDSAAPAIANSATTIAAYTGTYQGTLPCADCQGISIELTLQENGKAKSKTFVLKQKYLGKSANANAHTITGKWFLATGNKQNHKAKILQLIPDGKEDLMYFELLKDGSIKLLDKRQAQIKSKQNYTLKKQRA
ncbi:putative lipoprotein NlpE involved in copper resistance [Pontibacter aydingkolensis]|uniref:Copper resistance protein NlpE n=1 Tax=Pontibacter aydingkolensis TaxID=1911536 RepID=A0ABS7CUJ7_9BACT|nr:copper resistance protein NlpE [Pontibacter aydingkolensis]MBW7467526.1 copper resistance protein NlpE [Pontibacter aydingkolensis]